MLNVVGHSTFSRYSVLHTGQRSVAYMCGWARRLLLSVNMACSNFEHALAAWMSTLV
jgi:hypothetical protein